MPSENVANRLPPDALDAFLDGILAELRDPADPVALNEIRAAFRKRVPFNLRSYAAAALILRAAGLSARRASPLRRSLSLRRPGISRRGKRETNIRPGRAKARTGAARGTRRESRDGP